MNTIQVFDSSALLAMIKNEPGSLIVENKLAKPNAICFIHSLNLCEVYYVTIIENHRNEKLADAAISELGIIGLQVSNEMGPSFWQQAGKMKAYFTHLSLADAFCVVLAERMGGEIITADKGFQAPVSAGICKATFIR